MTPRWLTESVRTAVVAGAFGVLGAVMPTWISESAETERERLRVERETISGDDGAQRRARINCSIIHRRIYEFALENPELAEAALEMDSTGSTFMTEEEGGACLEPVTPVVEAALERAKKKP